MSSSATASGGNSRWLGRISKSDISMSSRSTEWRSVNKAQTLKSDGGALRCGIGGANARHAIQGSNDAARDPTKGDNERSLVFRGRVSRKYRLDLYILD